MGTQDTMQAAGTTMNMISLADVAGMWDLKVMQEMGDSVLITSTLTATADTTGWSLEFPNMAPVGLHVMPAMGDSIVVHAGPYSSALRSGVMVTTEMVTRLLDGRIVGTFVARYTTTTPDSVLRGRIEGTRKM
jgi:hypothetical protein